MSKKKPSGAEVIKAAGKSLVQLALTPEQKKKIRIAAAAEGVPMTQFFISHGLSAAEKILEKI